MNQKLIVIDGKTYKSVDEMPADVRRKYESAMSQLDKNNDGAPDLLENLDIFADKNRNGMPDALEGMVSNIMTSTKIIADGKSYNSIDELPPEVRAKYEQAMGAMDANRNGVPDFMEGMIDTSKQSSNIAASFESPAFPPSQPFQSVQSQPMPASPTLEEASSNGLALVLGVVLVLGLCVAGAIGVWYFFLR